MEVILLRNLLLTLIHKAGALTSTKSTKALAARLSTVQKKAAAALPFRQNSAFCWAWLIPAQSLCSDVWILTNTWTHLGVLGKVTWGCFAGPRYRRGILLLAVRGDAGCGTRTHEGGISQTQADTLLQPVSRTQPGWPAPSTQRITGTGPYRMRRAWHHLESCEEIQPMINSSSDNTMRTLAPCLPLQPPRLNSGLFACHEAV